MRLARELSSLCEIPGTSSRTPENSRAPMTSNLHSVSAVTVAVRGPRSSSDSSPKAAPGPSVATLRPLRFAVASPPTRMNISRPTSPCRTSSWPAFTVTSSDARASRWSSFFDNALNNGTDARWSRYVSLPPIPKPPDVRFAGRDRTRRGRFTVAKQW
jgi:hypothetical protein